MAEGVSVLREPRQHNDHHAALLPHQLPEVGCRCVEGPLGGDVGGVAGVVVRLEGEEGGVVSGR